jgi:hypothetical protein
VPIAEHFSSNINIKGDVLDIEVCVGLIEQAIGFIAFVIRTDVGRMCAAKGALGLLMSIPRLVVANSVFGNVLVDLICVLSSVIGGECTASTLVRVIVSSLV